MRYLISRLELVGTLERYEDSYRLCYVRGPEGIIGVNRDRWTEKASVASAWWHIKAAS